MSAAETVLIIDPDGPARRGTARVLTSAGYSVVQRPGGTSALAGLALDRPAVVLIAAVLPDDSSDAVIREIRRDRAMDDVAVLLLVNATTAPTKLIDALDAGADGFITRPQRRETLLAVVGARVRQRKAAIELRTSEMRSRALLTGLPDGAVERESIERKHAEERLQRSEALHRTAGRIARIGGFMIDLPAQTLYWSDEVCAIHDLPPGYTPTIEEGLALFPPEVRAGVTAHIHACIAEGTPYEFEAPKLTATGRRIWVRSIGEAVRNSTGSIVRIQGAFQDITARKDAESTLRMSEERFRLLSRATNDAIWDWDVVRDAMWWNDAFESLFGYALVAEPTIEVWLGHVHSDDRERVRQRIRRRLDGNEESWTDEYRFVAHDGRSIPVFDRGYIIRGNDGTPVRVVGGMTDATDHKRSEEALVQSRRALELLSLGNEALIRSESESDMLRDICQIAIGIGGFRFAWVGYAMDDATKSIAPQAFAGADSGRYLREVALSWSDDSPGGQGPAGIAIRTSEASSSPTSRATRVFHSGSMQPASMDSAA
jgi:PAS domain S-box-containing protein